jgi:hypothetical protein
LGLPKEAGLAVWGLCAPSPPSSRLNPSHARTDLRKRAPCFVRCRTRSDRKTVLKSSNANLFRSKPLPLPRPTLPTTGAPARAGRPLLCSLPSPHAGAPARAGRAVSHRAARGAPAFACPACKPDFIPIQHGRHCHSAGCAAALVRLGAAPDVPLFFPPFGFSHSLPCLSSPARAGRPGGSRPPARGLQPRAGVSALSFVVFGLPAAQPQPHLPCPLV